MTGRRVVEREVTIDAPTDAVWRALTEAEELVRWFPLEARVAPGPGGKIWMSWQEHYAAESHIELWEPGRRLRLRFPAHPPLHLATDYYLAGRGGETVLRVVTSGFGDGEAWDAMYGGVRRGWAFELDSLRHYLERHRGRDRHVAWARHAFAGPAAEAWRRLTDPGGWLGRSGLGEAIPGRRARLTTVDGDVVDGPVLIADPPYQLAMIAGNFGDALLRLEIEDHDGSVAVVVWLASWSPGFDPRPMQPRWHASLRAALTA